MFLQTTRHSATVQQCTRRAYAQPLAFTATYQGSGLVLWGGACRNGDPHVFTLGVVAVDRQSRSVLADSSLCTLLVEEQSHCRGDLEESTARNPAIQPGTGSTTKPGVAAFRRTPGKKMVISPNPKRGSTTCDARTKNSHLGCGTPLGFMGFVGVLLGCAVVTATPGFVVKPRWG